MTQSAPAATPSAAPAPAPAALDYRALFEAAPALYLVLTPQLTIVAASDAYLRATMTRREAIVGRALFEVFPDNPEDPAPTGVKNLRASLERVLTQRTADPMALQKYDIPRPESEGGGFEERYWSPLNSPVLDERREVRYIIHRVEDVTEFVRLKEEGIEHHQLAQTLRVRTERMEADLFLRAQQVEEADRRLISEERFRVIYEQAAVGIEQVGLDGRLLLVNAALCDLLGYPYPELNGKTFEEITYPEDRPREAELLRALLAGETGSYRLEKRYLRRDGTPVWVDLTTSLVYDRAGKPAYRISVVGDISARKQAEAEREGARAELEALNETLEERVQERTRQLSEINAEMEAFTYTVSHDLRAPLRSTQGFAQALEEDYGEQLDAEGKEYLARLVGSARRMEQLIEDLLGYSHLSRARFRRERVPLDAVLQEAMAQLGADVASSGARVSIEAPLPAVLAHRATLTQVMANLLSNAIKFTRAGQRPVVRVHAEPREAGIRLWVEDNGIGIKPEHQARIFRVFERLHGIEQYPGTGIGLAIVRKAIERMGGRVGVDSEPGQGSRFWVELPAERS